jgi:hypothetical protein
MVLMAVYYAEIQYTTTLTVRFELPDDLEATEEDVFEAAAYVDNHRGDWISDGTVLYIEKDEFDEDP